MVQFELFDIDNPCVGICQSDAKGYCIGCLRKRQERQWWHQMNDEQKRSLLRLLAIRRKKRQQSKANTANEPSIDDLPTLF